MACKSREFSSNLWARIGGFYESKENGGVQTKLIIWAQKNRVFQANLLARIGGFYERKENGGVQTKPIIWAQKNRGERAKQTKERAREMHEWRAKAEIFQANLLARIGGFYERKENGGVQTRPIIRAQTNRGESAQQTKRKIP
jgi:hypothetical protein